MTAMTAAMMTAAAVWAARDRVVWNVQAIQVMVDQAVRENRVVMVSADAVMAQRIHVVVTEAIQVVMTQRIARMNERAVTAFGSSKYGG